MIVNNTRWCAVRPTECRCEGNNGKCVLSGGGTKNAPTKNTRGRRE